MYPTESQSPQELLSPELQPRSILVVDDNEVILSIVRDILTRNGFYVRCVDNTTAARQKIAEQQPDIIICDIMMPHEDGFSLYKSLREHESFQGIPFVFLTGMTESAEVRFAKELGGFELFCFLDIHGAVLAGFGNSEVSGCLSADPTGCHVTDF